MTLQQHLDAMDGPDLLHLYTDAERLHATGVLPDDARLRQLTEDIFGESTVLHMTTVAYNIYRLLASFYIDISA